jgi:hypothetical protein
MSKQICQQHHSQHRFIEKLRMNEHVFATRARARSLSLLLFDVLCLSCYTDRGAAQVLLSRYGSYLRGLKLRGLQGLKLLVYEAALRAVSY